MVNLDFLMEPLLQVCFTILFVTVNVYCKGRSLLEFMTLLVLFATMSQARALAELVNIYE